MASSPGSSSGLRWILAANLAAAMDYSLIMPTAWQYVHELGGSHMFYGATVAAYPIGRICAILPVGYWSDRRGFRGPFLVVFASGVVGGLAYGAASAGNLKWLAPLGRFLSGIAAAGPVQAWAARTFPPHTFVRINSSQNAAQLLGVIVGPAVNIMFVGLDVRIGWLQLNPRTCAGYLPAAMCFVFLVGFWRYVAEPPEAEAQLAERTGDSMSSRASGSLLFRLRSTGAWVCLLSAFATNLQISAFDSVAPPLTASHLQWGLIANSCLFVAVAFVCLFGALGGMLADKVGVGAPDIWLMGSLVNVVSAFIVAASSLRAPSEIPMTAFLVSCAFMVLSNLFYGGPVAAVFQHACGDAQGFLGGVNSICQAAGRPVGALLGGHLLDGSPLPFSSSIFGIVVLTILLQLAVRRRLTRTVRTALSSSLSLATEDATVRALCLATDRTRTALEEGVCPDAVFRVGVQNSKAKAPVR